MREENGGHILTGFRTPLPHTVKLHILEWPFIVYCFIVSLRKISAKEKSSQTQI